MINQQLLDYVRQQLASGVSKEDVVKSLIANGWQVPDINEAFSSIEKTPSVFTPSASPATQSGSATQASVHVMETPAQIRRFELYMYTSIAISFVASAVQYSKFTSALTIATLSSVFLIAGFTLIARTLIVWLAVHKRMSWGRWVLLILLILNLPSTLSVLIFTGSMLNPLVVILDIGQLVLQVIALCFVFSKLANNWYASQAATASTAAVEPKNAMWSKGIPRINWGFMTISLLLVFVLDLGIIISTPGLLSFWFLMLGVLAIFAVFFCLENFVFRNKFADTTSALDPWIAATIVVRNAIFVLNFVPVIQLLGLALIAGFLAIIPGAIFGSGGFGDLGDLGRDSLGIISMIVPGLLVLYIILIIARFSTTKREVQ